MKDFTKIISTLTAFLLALGFVNNYGYYSHFDIEIFTYLNSSEIILAFLPIIIPLLISLLLVIYQTLMVDYKFENEKKNNPFITNKDLTFWGPFKDFIKLARNKFKTDEKVGETIYHFTVQILARLIYLSVFLGLTYIYAIAFIKKQGFPYDSPIMFFIVSIIWLLFIAYKANKYFNSRFKEISKSMTITAFLLGFLGTIYLYNSFKAFRILESKPIYSIELTIKDHNIKTNEKLLYIGKTKEYYFLRDLESNKNIIYNDRNIDNVKTTKIIYDQK